MGGSLTFFIARLIPSVLAVATTALLTRLLQPSAYGLYSLGLSFIFLTTIGAFEWLGLSLMRLSSTADRPEVFFGTVMTAFTAVSLMVVLIAALVVVVPGHQDAALFTVSWLFAGIASAWFELKQRLQMAELKTKSYFYASVVRGVITTTLVVTTASLTTNAPDIFLALGISSIISSLTVSEPRLNILRRQFDKDVFVKLWKYGLPLSISVGLATILFSIDKWMLQGLSGPHAVGLFTAAALIGNVPITTLASCIGPSSYSMAVHAVEFRSPEAAETQLEQNFLLLLGLVLPGAVGIVTLSANLAHTVVGPAYWDAVIDLAPWLACTAVLSSLRAFYVDTAFQLAKNVSPLIWTMLLAIVVNAGVDFWLIPISGELGAAIGSCVAIFASLIVAWIISRRVYRLPVPIAGSLKILASIAVMFLVLRQISGASGLGALVAQITIGAIVYLAAVTGLNVLGARDRLVQRVYQVRRLFFSNR